MDAGRLHRSLAAGLRRSRGADGGFASSAGARSELEPTAVAALALDDRAARRWLAARQRPDGGFRELDGRLVGPATTALASIVLEDPGRGRRALGFALRLRGLPPPDVDPERRVGWGWTADARSLVEPTARVLVALRRLAPRDSKTQAEALGLLRERRCVDGGWNYGNATHLDVDLRSYAQTTAIALVALRDGPDELVDPALGFLRRTWSLEPGALTTAQALLAFRVHAARSDERDVEAALEGISNRTSFLSKPLAVAWAVLATAPGARLAAFGGRM